MIRFVLLVAAPVALVSAQTNSLRDDLQRARGTGDRPAASRSAEADRLATIAAEAFREAQPSRAVDAYDRAAAEAYRAGATGSAFEYGLAAAQIQLQRGEAADAASRFRRAALRNANDPRAADAHFAACVAYGRELTTGATAARLDAYAELLDEHVAAWPRSPHSADLWWRHTESLALRRDWRAVAARVRSVADDDPSRDRAVELLLAAHQSRLDAGEASAAFVEEATADLLPIILGIENRWPADWSAAQRDAAATLAAIHLAGRDEGAEYAARLLSVALRGEPEPTAEWRRRAVPLLVAAQLGLGVEDDSLADQVPTRDERERLLARAAATAAADGPIAAADELRRTLDALSPLASTRPASADATIEALLAAGRGDAALDRLADQAATETDDRGAQTAYAKRLAEGDDPSERAKALELWRVIELRSDRRTPAWFEARLARVRLLSLLGRRDDATKLLRLTRLVAPDLGGEPFAADFEAVAASLR